MNQEKKKTPPRLAKWPDCCKENVFGYRNEAKVQEKIEPVQTMDPTSAMGADDVDGWLRRSLDCVTCDGNADTQALDIVQFAHDLAVARTVIASIRADGFSDGVVLAGIRVPHPRNARQLAMLAVEGCSAGEWRALAGMKPNTNEYVLGSDVSPLGNDAVAALLALSARSRMAPFEAVAGCDVAASDAHAWVVRMGRALALRSTPWDLSAIDQEVGLARTLIKMMAARRSRCASSVPVRLTGRGLSDEDASAYRAAIALWDRYGLVFFVSGMPQRIPGDDPSYGLRVFIAAAERMQATPGFYLTLVAPAIAARLQPGLDALDKTTTNPTDSAS